ncbi:Bgt-20962 [Blumeria graminis f. sp. tritici]|uniref:Bgt-20962 n=2 Tax=Blumeria graminis f. sp. tritici TaxID=62690 RepID=A0A9X9QBQ5_BLUGR|nr:Bgt-20962 [Blumeria graminis f. sp. tritici]
MVVTLDRDFPDILSRSSVCPPVWIKGVVKRRIGRPAYVHRYTKICCARLSDIFVIGEPRTSGLCDFSLQLNTCKWLSLGWLEMADNCGMTALLRVYSNEDLWGYYCWKEVVKEA